MKIAQISPYSWDAPGGVQAHIRQLTKRLRGRGHDVLILAPGEHPGYDPPGVKIVGRPFHIRANGAVARICFSRSSKRVVREALDEFAPDLVHAHDPLVTSTSRWATMYTNAPVVATFHSYFAPESLAGRCYTALAPFGFSVWRRLDQRIAVSEAARESVAYRMGEDPIHIVPNGTDVHVFERAVPAKLPKGRTMLFVGRLEPRKGFPIAVRAFARLAQQYDDVQLIVVGEGVEREAVEMLSRKLRSRVHLLGRVSDRLLPGYYAAADVFIAPALGSESFGIVLVEAMAAGVPIVASDIAGYREVVRHRREALLVPSGDPAALADAVGQLFEHPAEARALREAGQIRAKRYDWDTILTTLERIYGAALGAPSRAAEMARA
ncbi:MAG TPA: glycosyltransferase family 4 protein [Gemmatimonadaceae bacterium]|nr:glycosyltransferase family 4 protein [Gemmatimonadaceae bacterium]